jgi:hypothetical protein
MQDGMLLGVIIFCTGLVIGANGVFWLMVRSERERETLHQIIGRQQERIDSHVEVPEQEW